MSIDIEVTGYEEAMEKTEKMMKDISQLVPDMGNAIVSTAEGIVKRAKEICNDPDCKKIKRNNIEFRDNTFSMSVEYLDLQSYDCMIQAIRERLQSTHDWQNQILEAELKRIEEMKKSAEKNVI